MPRTILLSMALIPMLLGLGSFDNPGPTVNAPQQLRSRAAAGSLELVAHDPRGRPVLQADECELELRRDGKRVWKEFPESARFIVRRGPNGGVAVEQVEVGERH